MNPCFQRTLFAVALAWLSLPGPAAAAEAQASCVGYIDPALADIRTPGTWCLRENVTFNNRRALDVFADDVTIDCKGFTLKYVGPTAINFAIDVAGRSNVTVRNCTIKNFLIAVGTKDVYSLLIEGNRFDGNSVQVIGGDGAVRGNVFRNAGLQATSGNVDILDNTVIGLNSRTPDGIRTNSSNASVRGNSVSGGAGIIANRGSPKIRGNVLTGDGTGIGIDCWPGTVARLKDNLVTGYPTPTQACIDAGGNQATP